MKTYIKEACVENLQQAINAEKKGADRIELCARLDLDGLTPSEDLIAKVRDQLIIPIRVMIRPRAGDFVYSDLEIAEMKSSILLCKNLGVDGVVFGVLNQDGTMNMDAIRVLTHIATPLHVVIHKAIDETPDKIESFREISEVKGISTVLTSGGAITALDGQEIVKEMILLSTNGIEIMPAGKITDVNIHKVHSMLGASAYHGKRIVGIID